MRSFKYHPSPPPTPLQPTPFRPTKPAGLTLTHGPHPCQSPTHSAATAVFLVESPLSVFPDWCRGPQHAATARLLTCKPGFLQSTKRRVESELAMVMLVWGAGMTATAVRGTRLSEGSTVRRVFPEERHGTFRDLVPVKEPSPLQAPTRPTSSSHSPVTLRKQFQGFLILLLPQ